MDLAQATNAPREIVIAGLPYKVSALTRSEWGVLQAWIKDHALDPVSRAYAELSAARAKGVEVSAEDRDATMRAAREEGLNWPPKVASLAWFDLLGSIESGAAQLVHVILSKHQPAITFDQSAQLASEVDQETFNLIGWRAIGIEPPPKATTPAEPDRVATEPLGSSETNTPSPTFS